MTSPEWEAANEDDSDRFPQPSPHVATQPLVDPLQSDPARVARYAGMLRAAEAEVRQLRRQWHQEVENFERETARAESAEAEVERLRAESVESGSLYAQWRDDCAARAEAAEAKVAKVEALLTPDTTWRCSDCGWVADEQTIEQALWREAERTVSMVCPECSAEGSFVDHEPLVEDVSDLVHAAWMDTKREQGVTSRLSEWGEEQMVPYAELSERAKDLDRGTVRAVLAAVRAVLADAPAEQRDEGCA